MLDACLPTRRLAAKRRAAEAGLRTEAVSAKVAAFDRRLLQDRNRRLAGRSKRVEAVFNTQGPEAIVEVIQRSLAT